MPVAAEHQAREHFGAFFWVPEPLNSLLLLTAGTLFLECCKGWVGKLNLWLFIWGSQREIYSQVICCTAPAML